MRVHRFGHRIAASFFTKKRVSGEVYQKGAPLPHHGLRLPHTLPLEEIRNKTQILTLLDITNQTVPLAMRDGRGGAGRGGANTRHVAARKTGTDMRCLLLLLQTDNNCADSALTPGKSSTNGTTQSR